MKTCEFNVGENVIYDARMAGELVAAVSKFSSNVFIMAGNARVNAKSIIGVISLALKPGDKVAVSAQGSDETQAAETVEKLLG